MESPLLLYQIQWKKMENERRMVENIAKNEKRWEEPVHNKTDSKECNHLGYEYYASPITDVCKGEICFLEQVNCNGKIYNVTNGEVEGINLISDCYATKLRCKDRLADMKDRYQGEKCSITDFLCEDSNFYNSSNYSPSMDIRRCAVRVACEDHRIYGFDDFGFKCERQDLFCDGKEVDLNKVDIQNPDFQKGLTSCQVKTSSCAFEDKKCKSVQRACNRDIVDDCKVQTTPVNCLKDSQGHFVIPSCQISSLQCNGNLVNISSYIGPFSNCTVKEINCNGTSVSSPSNCKLDRMTCAGVQVRASIYFGSLQLCTVRNLTCSENSECTTFTPRCQGGPDCELIVRRFECENTETCQQPLNTTHCLCPEDRYGLRCEKQVPLKCEAIMRSPEKDCSKNPWMVQNYQNNPKTNLLNGDPACLIFSMSETIHFEYQMQCKATFKNNGWTVPGNVTINGKTIPIPPPEDELDPYGFNYWVSTQDLKLSEEQDWGVEFKIYDFSWLSRPHLVEIPHLNQFQVAGVEAMVFPLTLKDVEDRYWAGNRLYYEIGWDKENKPEEANAAMDRGFIDPSDRPLPSFPTPTSKTTLALAIILPLLGTVLIGGLVFYFWKKRNSQDYHLIGQDEDE